MCLSAVECVVVGDVCVHRMISYETASKDEGNSDTHVRVGFAGSTPSAVTVDIFSPMAALWIPSVAPVLYLCFIWIVCM